ncbi:hypothetical protein V1264_020610 [Littorina saxatilis]|uniref:Fucolectin tachylectin-4 pentraxin-1 domain-containing protein n=1 Tax=Littorina saxatilis TaxID=31220 RepID=A0AAN9BBB4_9CAEN
MFLFLLASAQGQRCSCKGGCDIKGATFPGSDGRRVNVAYGKEASMSSVFTRHGQPGPACAAVNGRTGTVWPWRLAREHDVNCVHTNERDYDAWWQVDLGHNYTVTDITIYRRKDSARRMSGMSVFVDGQLCHVFPHVTADPRGVLDSLPEKIDVDCTPPIRGRIVRFQKHGHDRTYQGGNYLINMCEVQVWACKPGLYGAQCDQACSGHCQDNTCDTYNGTCPHGCEPGWTSPLCNQTESDDLAFAGQMVGIGLGASFGIAAFILIIIGLCGRKSKHQKSSQTKASPSASLDQSLHRDDSFENGLDISAVETVENAKNEDPVYVNIASTKRNAGYTNHVYAM